MRWLVIIFTAGITALVIAGMPVAARWQYAYLPISLPLFIYIILLARHKDRVATTWWYCIASVTADLLRFPGFPMATMAFLVAAAISEIIYRRIVR